MKKTLIIITALVLVAGMTWLVLGGKDEAQNTQSSANQQSATNQIAESAETEKNEDLQEFTAEQVAQHNTESDCWAIIDNQVYDLTEFISSHPGGDEILRACGVDATTLFQQRRTDDGQRVGSGTSHSSSAQAQLEGLVIGHLAAE